jgi:hypothetical protein
MISPSVLKKLAGRRFGQIVVDEEQSNYTLQADELNTRCDCGTSFSRFSPKALLSGRVTHCRGKAHKWTYALLASDVSVVKIGCAEKIEPRIADIQRMSGAALTLIGIADNNVEAFMHANLSLHWSHGEWFRFAPEVQQAIKDKMRPMSLPVLPFAQGRSGAIPCLYCKSVEHSCRDCDRESAKAA